MDLGAYDTKGRAEAGSPMRLRCPVRNEPLGTDEAPARVILKGIESQAAQAAIREARAAEMTRADETPMDVHARMVQTIAPLIVGFENVEINGKPLTAADAVQFLELQHVIHGSKGQSFVEQCSVHVFERGNYLGNVSAA